MKSEKCIAFSDKMEAVIRRHAGDQTEDDEEIYGLDGEPDFTLDDLEPTSDGYRNTCGTHKPQSWHA